MKTHKLLHSIGRITARRANVYVSDRDITKNTYLIAQTCSVHVCASTCVTQHASLDNMHVSQTFHSDAYSPRLELRIPLFLLHVKAWRTAVHVSKYANDNNVVVWSHNLSCIYSWLCFVALVKAVSFRVMFDPVLRVPIARVLCYRGILNGYFEILGDL